MQQLSSEIKLRIHTALGMTIYLMECLQSQAWTNITGWNPKPNNRLQSDPIVISVSHVTSARRCDTVGRCNGRGRGGCRGLSGMQVDNPPHVHTGAGMTRLGWKEVNHPPMGLGWHAQMGASLSMKGPRSSGVV